MSDTTALYRHPSIEPVHPGEILREDVSGAALEALRETIREALAAQGLTVHRAAVAAGLPRDAVRRVLEGREPRAGRLAAICAALGLEFYVGPPVGPPGVKDLEARLATTTAERNRLRDVLKDLIREVHEATGEDCPDLDTVDGAILAYKHVVAAIRLAARR